VVLDVIGALDVKDITALSGRELLNVSIEGVLNDADS